MAIDASFFELSGIFSQRMPNGGERPIPFALRALTTSVKNYSQLDREPTVVFWACRKCYDYIFVEKLR